ncbi:MULTISPECIES: PDZ domain-containing protein [unclassified Sphingomonas]|uniref:PDZ domain-containing protein n=1 Tax=unclassified Sphingomonas TaxID=196159 RepID=UPI002151E107|nr:MULTISPECIES: PDZ domain-containing protein [unclassified Sphingomonas]MCR5869457.1 PDZ domain-containing protein [Sphingomonas sp. J344]UUX98813.1 PDZ domain-containing protein [Sphingomonas sp. J315]
MKRLYFAAFFAAGAAFALSPGHVSAQTPGPVNMGIQLKEHPEGAEVMAVLPGATAAAMGLKVGDIVLELGGKPISRELVQEHAQNTKAGDTITLKVKRGKEILQLAGPALPPPG